MSKNTIYQITLTPIGRFFFGGEVVFGGGEDAQDERRRSYLVHSNLLPQQTTLLGMLREELLRKNHLLKPWRDDQKADKQGNIRSKVEKKEAAVALVGKSGFAIGSSADFGLIKRLSPLVLCDRNEQQYQVAPLDDRMVKIQKGDQMASHPLAWISKQNANEPLRLKAYNPKNELQLAFAPAAKETAPKPLADFFQQQDQVGIKVSNRLNWRKNSGDEEGFFRHSSYRNDTSVYAQNTATAEKPKGQQAYSFRFWVEVAQPDQTTALWQDGLVQMGGERSTFKMKVEKQVTKKSSDEGLFTVVPRYNTTAPAGYERILLLNDTYLPAEVLKSNGVFALAHTQHFRFFSSDLETVDNFYDFRQKRKRQGIDKQIFQFNKITESTKGRQQSKRYTFLQRGGVLLVPTAQLNIIKNAISQRQDFRQIGYNYFQIL
ncbi:MAG: type III-B CRISPR module-associated Cmr3 family protein [Bacteroidota bacterium]